MTIGEGTVHQLPCLTPHKSRGHQQASRELIGFDFSWIAAWDRSRSSIAHCSKGNGSLPDIDYLKLVPASDLRNAGIDVALPYNGPAPDLGPFESVE
jgi:hypothetical protein